jgi:cytochrome b6-f complex iron-sulfur subunit
MTIQPHSRLEAEPMPRRDFLGLAAMWSAGAAMFFALLGALRLPRAAVVPAPSRKFKVNLPDSLAPETPYFAPGHPVALFKGTDGVYAVSTVCTHLGCIVKQKGSGFGCPCHGSEFRGDGSVVKGPAPRALPWLAVKKEGDAWVVDEEKTVPLGTKVT